MKVRQIPSSLVRDLSEQQAKTAANDYIAPSAKEVRKLVCNEAERRLATSIAQTDSQLRFNSPNYALNQAYDSGYRRAWREIIDLLGN